VDVFLLVYSVTDRQSFRYVQQCLQDVAKVRRRRAGLLVVANKYDLVRNRVVSTAGPSDTALSFLFFLAILFIYFIYLFHSANAVCLSLCLSVCLSVCLTRITHEHVYGCRPNIVSVGKG